MILSAQLRYICSNKCIKDIHSHLHENLLGLSCLFGGGISTDDKCQVRLC